MLTIRGRDRVFRLEIGPGVGPSVPASELDRVLADVLELLPRAGARTLVARLGLDPIEHDDHALRALVGRLIAIGRLRLHEVRRIPDLRDPTPADRPEPGEPPEPPPSTEHQWVEIQILDDQDEPVAGIEYEIDLTDGRTRRGKSNANGVIRYDRIPGGKCEVRLLGLDKDAYEKV